MPQLAIAPSFLDDFSRLDRSIQSATLSVMRDFMSGSRPHDDSVAERRGDVQILNVGPEWSGVVVPTGEDVFCLLTVRRHDEAVAYARDWRPENVPALAVRAVPKPRAAEQGPPQVSAPPALADALQAPFTQWRRTPHPDHWAIIDADYAGSAQVSGGPSTGAGVVGLHRAARLAERLTARVHAGDPAAVLLATAGRVRAQTLAGRLDALLPDAAVRSRVDVVSMDGLAGAVVGERTRSAPRLLSGEELDTLWQQAAAADGVPFPGRFLVDEWEQVILAREITDLATYIRCDRNGRQRHLAPEFRTGVWRAVQRYSGAMRAQQQWGSAQLAAEAARMLARSGPRYRHAVADGAHSLHPAQLRLLRASVPEDANDLFLVTDPAQRLADPRVSLASVGIQVRGRARVLRTDYRTTAEIRGFAAGILGGEHVSEAVLRGRAPRVHRAAGRAEEYAAVTAQVRAWLDAGVAPQAVAVGGRNHWVVRRLAKELQASGIPTAPVDAPEQEDAVRVDTLHALAGQEFACTALVGLGEAQLPPRAALAAAAGDPAAIGRTYRSERVLLYAAVLSARDALFVSYVQTPSRLLPGSAAPAAAAA